MGLGRIVIFKAVKPDSRKLQEQQVGSDFVSPVPVGEAGVCAKGIRHPLDKS